jgi:hypothetical protein
MAVALFPPAAQTIYFSFVTNVNTVTQDTVQYKAPGMCQSFACLQQTHSTQMYEYQHPCTTPKPCFTPFCLNTLANLHFLISTLSFLV